MNKPAHLRTSTCITDTSRSPNVVFAPVGLENVQMREGFWSARRQVNRDVSLKAIGDYNRRTGRIENLRRAAGLAEGDFEGLYFNDSDVYKWMEAVFWSLHDGPDAALEAEMDELIAVIAKAQLDDGYINSYYQLGHLEERWTDFSMHEFYCGGHLIQAAIADFRTRGKTALLDVACKFADHIVARFGSGEVFGAPGHQLIEMALVELYRITGKRDYLDLSWRLVEARGNGTVCLFKEIGWKDASYHQDHIPLREAKQMAGHAVRQMYYLAGAADCVAEQDDSGIAQALDRLWANMTGAHLYLGGGIGPRWEIEGFGEDFEMPLHHAHCESCASVGSFMWNWRMLQKTGDGRFADLCEHTLYNSAISGVSLDGKRFFYQNPLGDSGRHRRSEWFQVACCPSNIARLLAQLPGYLASTRDAGVALHFYSPVTLDVPLQNGVRFEAELATGYPADGQVELRILADAVLPLWFRIPAWAGENVTVDINGEKQVVEADAGYLCCERAWNTGDVVTLRFDMNPRRIYGNSHARDLACRVAVMRGPVVYAWEQHDNPDIDIPRMGLPEGSVLADTGESIAGLPLIEARVLSPRQQDGFGALYSETEDRGAAQTVRGRAIPYAFWGNRSPGPMEVWLLDKR